MVGDIVQTHLLACITNAVPMILVSQHAEALRETTHRLALTMYCEAKNKPCGNCPSCIHINHNSHPDIVEASSEGSTISMKEISSLLHQGRQTPFHAYRLVIIPLADRLSRPAVSALLKSLEEPATKTRYILTTRYKKRILPTILSRCRIFHVPSTKHSEVSASLPVFGIHQGPLSEDDLSAIEAHLTMQIQHQGFSPSLLRAFLRLRDYYKIKSERGNEKLASEVLLATLTDNTSI